jgi:hypothetical protein
MQMKLHYELDLNFELLRQQKVFLLSHASEEEAKGLLSLLEAIQDQAVDTFLDSMEVFGEVEDEEN